MTKGNPKNRIAICGVVHRESFDDPQVLADALQAFFSAAKIQIQGETEYRGDRQLLKPLRSGGLAAIFPVDDFAAAYLCFASGECEVSRWPILFDSWGTNVQIRIWLHESSVEVGVAILKAMVTHMGLFWGEVNDPGVTNFPTFCGLNDHYAEVPGIGAVNYFGAEYVRYFGGIERFGAAPHLRIEQCAEGLMTRLNCRDFEDFKAKQTAVHRHLGELLFTPAPVTGGDVDPKTRVDRLLFWPNAPRDGRDADALFQKTVDLGTAQKERLRAGPKD